jgi:hypothetical protein
MFAKIYRHNEIPNLVMSALAGNEHDRKAATAIKMGLAEIDKDNEHERIACFNCDTTFNPRRMPAAFLLVFAKKNMFSGVCERCLAMQESIAQRLAPYR